MSVEAAPLALETVTAPQRVVSTMHCARDVLTGSHYPNYLDRFIENHPDPLSSACSRGDNVLLKQLLNHGVHPAQDTQDPLIIAAAMRNQAGVALLLQHGANPNLRSRSGLRGPVHAAIGKDPQWALQIRLNPIWRAEARRLPADRLSADFERAERDIIRLLAHAGADLNNDLGGFETPLHVAILDSNIAMQALLLRLGANLDIPNYRGATARHLLGPELTRMLIDLAIG
ncbi:ankyrin repeat domain-containing protein [Pseudomonas sp. S1(2024)]|uniref:ankyrin repeat domain-containing protein n=1 Tax=Pseudomonas sp. S1(2024) TaxID=3390191 RepID=UPI00397D50EA